MQHSNTNCVQCENTATIHASWPTSQGSQQARFCEPCMDKLWGQFKNTPSFQGIILAPIDKKQTREHQDD